MAILIAIKPKHINEILNGNKKYEFRKRIFKNRTKDSILIYASSPTKKIVAHFQLGRIIEGHPEDLWKQFCDVSGIGEEEFFQYFAGRKTGCALQIKDLIQYEKPIDPKAVFENFVPPQSFCYVDHHTDQAELLNVNADHIWIKSNY